MAAEEIRCDCLIRLPRGADPPDGELVVAIEDVTEVDAPSVPVHEERRRVGREDWRSVDGRPAVAVRLACPAPDRRTRDLAISARLVRGPGGALRKGDWLTVQAHPLPKRHFRGALDMVQI